MLSRIAITTFAGTILAATLPAADWPTFRGDAAQTGISTDKLPDQLVERWKYQTTPDKAAGGIESTAAIAKGVVYVGAFDDHLHALDLGSGTVKWKCKTGAIKAPVGVQDDRVFVGNVDGMFYCVNAADGKVRWQYETGAEITSGSNFGNGTVLFGSHDETLYCLNRDDGKLRWKFQIGGGPVMGTPAVIGGKTFAAGCDSTLHVLDAATGIESAHVDIGGQVGASAAAGGDMAFLGTMTSQVVAVDLKKAEVAWTFESPRARQPFFSSAALTEKLIVIGSRDKRVYAIDRPKGTEVWSFPTEGKVDSSPVIVGQRAYFGSLDGHLYVLELATGKEVQRLKLDGPVLASPAVGSGCVVIGTEKGTLYCFGAAK